MSSPIEEIWKRIQNAIRNKCDPPPEVTYNSPASEQDIKELEEKMSLILPEDFKESLRLHNGMERFPTGELLSTERVYDEWKVWTDLLDEGTFDDDVTDNDTTVQNCWWSKKWVPIVADGGGNGECLDLDPGETGNVGQVIFMDHEDGQRPVLGSSFTEWLDGVATKLESGELPYETGCCEH